MEKTVTIIDMIRELVIYDKTYRFDIKQIL